MPSSPPLRISTLAKYHIAGAKRNYEAYQRFIDSDRDVEWAIVRLFYAAVHLVVAFEVALTGERGCVDHKQRREFVHHRIGKIETEFQRLFNAIMDARYELISYDKARTAEFHDKCFRKIRGELQSRGIAWELPESSE